MIPSLTSISLSILGILLFGYIIRLVSQRKILLSYSLLWILLSLLLVILPLFPEPVYGLARFFGIELPSNFIFILAIIILLFISLSLSIIASKQTAYSKTLVQEIALINKEIDELKLSRNQ